MRRKINFISAIMAVGLLAGFGKTETTISENNPESGVLVAKAAQEDEGSSEWVDSFNLPQTFTGEWSGVNGLVNVCANAELILLKADTIPTATIERRSFTQEDVDKFLSVFLQGSTLYEPQQMTRQEIEERLEEYRAMERGELPLSGDTTLEKIPYLIEYYTELAKTAPNKGEKFPASGEFVSDGERETVVGYGEADGENVHIFVENNPYAWDQAICYTEGYGNLMGAYMAEIPEENIAERMEVSEAEAVETGDTLIKELDMGTMVCDSIRPVMFYDFEQMLVEEKELSDLSEYSKSTGYELQYVRTVEDIPIGYTEYRGNSVPENESFEGVWTCETVTIYVNTDGVVYFQWVSPHTEPVTDEQDVQLLDFEDIEDIFGKMVMVKNNYLEQINNINNMRSTWEMDIDRVELNLMRIRDKNNLFQGEIVPVWDFWGTTTFFADENAVGTERYEIVLTINAMDGTVVDRELGY